MNSYPGLVALGLNEILVFGSFDKRARFGKLPEHQDGRRK